MPNQCHKPGCIGLTCMVIGGVSACSYHEEWVWSVVDPEGKRVLAEECRVVSTGFKEAFDEIFGP